ncbi:MAG: sigma-70 family RNA polymerase sigma factor [Thermoanaerobaculia bacterium]
MEAHVQEDPLRVAEALFLDDGWRRKLIGFAWTRFGIGAEDAEDLLQETAFELLRQRGYVRRPEGFVFVVYRARCARFLSASRSRREVLSETDPALESFPSPVPDTSPDPDRQIAVREALHWISSSCRRILAAYYVEGQSLRETAEKMSLAYSSVAKTLSRCLQKLRRCLS